MNRLRKIIVENKIPFIAPLLEGLAEQTVFLSPEEIDATATADADALIVRTRTRCDASLLDGSRVRFIATATIGTDHIDLDYCSRRGITVSNAPGCNAPAVAQWVFAAILAMKGNRPLGEIKLGVVGVGHVGSIVARWGRSMGMEVLLNDPPRASREGEAGFTSLADVARHCDVITFHTPLDDTTRHLAGRQFLGEMRHGAILLNAARGPVVDTEALCEALENHAIGPVAIDCWEGEPQLSRRLLDLTAIATPHIAGYSLQGKQRASLMAVESLKRFIGMEPGDASSRVFPVPDAVTPESIAASYDILADDRALRANPSRFEQLRNTYPLRHETKN